MVPHLLILNVPVVKGAEKRSLVNPFASERSIVFGIAKGCTGPKGALPNKIYNGDGNADIGDGCPIQSVRIYQVFFQGSSNNGVWSTPPLSRT